jgi:DNA-directed RNA polymerase subunit H (RpoH/RPB5)
MTILRKSSVGNTARSVDPYGTSSGEIVEIARKGNTGPEP